MSLESPFGLSSSASAASPAADGDPGMGVVDETPESTYPPTHQQLENRPPGLHLCADARTLKRSPQGLRKLLGK